MIRGLPRHRGIFYARIPPNIDKPTQRLAELAIESASKAKEGRDGISYLINAKCCGIMTLLFLEYEKEIFRQTGTKSLVEALEVSCAYRLCDP